jgi:hypothetical protein
MQFGRIASAGKPFAPTMPEAKNVLAKGGTQSSLVKEILKRKKAPPTFHPAHAKQPDGDPVL